MPGGLKSAVPTEIPEDAHDFSIFSGSSLFSVEQCIRCILGSLEVGACEGEHGWEVSEGAVSACFPFRRQEDAQEALREGVGETAFSGGEDAVEVIGEGPSELGHRCEQRVSGVGDSEVAYPGTQVAVRPLVVGAWRRGLGGSVASGRP